MLLDLLVFVNPDTVAEDHAKPQPDCDAGTGVAENGTQNDSEAQAAGDTYARIMGNRIWVFLWVHLIDVLCVKWVPE